MTATIISTLTAAHSGSLIRPLVSLVVAFFVTICLFWIMQHLIETADRSLESKGPATVLEFVRVERDEFVHVHVKKPEAPPKPDVQPPQPPAPRLDNPNPTSVEVAVAPVPVDAKVKFTGNYNLGAEGDYLPIVKVAPIYPNRALTRGLEGYCVVEYTVTHLGTIKDPAVVRDQCSSTLFYDASINAALKFKYKPRFVGGEAVEVTGVQNKFTFEIVE